MSEILDSARVTYETLAVDTPEWDIIVDALNKLEEMEQKYEVGVKPDLTEHNGYCGNCSYAFGYEKVHKLDRWCLQSCSVCGTKIDWSDEE